MQRADILNKNIQSCFLAAHHAPVPCEGLTFLHNALLSIDELINIESGSDAPTIWELEKLRYFVIEKIRDASRSDLPEQDLLELCGLDPLAASTDRGHQMSEDVTAWSFDTPAPDWSELKQIEQMMRSFDAELPIDAFLIRISTTSSRSNQRPRDTGSLLMPTRAEQSSNRSFPDPMLSVARGLGACDFDRHQSDERSADLYGGRMASGRVYNGEHDEFSQQGARCTVSSGEYNGSSANKRPRGESGPYHDGESRDYPRRGIGEDARQNLLYSGNGGARHPADGRREQSPPGGWTHAGRGGGGVSNNRYTETAERYDGHSRSSGRQCSGGGGGGGGGGQRGFISGAEKLRIEMNDRRGGGGGNSGGGGGEGGNGGGAVKKSLGGKRPPNAFTPPWIKKNEGGADGGYADRGRPPPDAGGGEEVRSVAVSSALRSQRSAAYISGTAVYSQGCTTVLGEGNEVSGEVQYLSL
jgi:hypothetical protein